MIKGFEDTIEWYNQNAEHYAEATKDRGSEVKLNDFVNELPREGKVLDAGCGPGRDSYRLSERGLDVTGLDLSSGLIEQARKRYPDINFQEGSFLNTNFENEEFDGIWAHASLVHLETEEDVRKTLKEFNRILKKAGILLILVKAQTGEDKTAVVSDSLSGHDRFFQYFLPDELKSLVQNAGFEEVFFEHYNEADKNPQGRPEVEWLYMLARKIS